MHTSCTGIYYRRFIVSGFFVLTLATLFFMLVGQAVSVRAAPENFGDGTSRVPGQYIVVFKDSVTNIDVVERELIERTRAERLDTYRYALRGFSAQLSPEAAERLMLDPRVEFVSEDRVVSIDFDRSYDESRTESRVESRRVNSLATPTSPNQPVPNGIRRIRAMGLF